MTPQELHELSVSYGPLFAVDVIDSLKISSSEEIKAALIAKLSIEALQNSLNTLTRSRPVTRFVQQQIQETPDDVEMIYKCFFFYCRVYGGSWLLLSKAVGGVERMLGIEELLYAAPDEFPQHYKAYTQALLDTSTNYIRVSIKIPDGDEKAHWLAAKLKDPPLTFLVEEDKLIWRVGPKILGECTVYLSDKKDSLTEVRFERIQATDSSLQRRASLINLFFMRVEILAHTTLSIRQHKDN